MRTLVPLKIKVGLDEITGYAKYPNFNLGVNPSIRKGLDWSKYIDVHGGGMHYDKTCGHKEDSVDSPYGQQWCCMCVPSDFANAAVAAFPGEVSIISEVDFEAFYNDKAHAHEPDDILDTEALNGLNAQRQLMVARGTEVAALDVKITRALDNTNPERGVRKNPNKTWADVKKAKGITIQ